MSATDPLIHASPDTGAVAPQRTSDADCVADQPRPSKLDVGPRRVRRDLAAVLLVTLATFGGSAAIEFYENWLSWTRVLEPYQADELPLTFLVMALAIGWFAWRRWQEFRSELRLRIVTESKLDQSEQQYRMLSRRYLAAQESERRHLARDLHDELGQYLNAIKIDAVSLRERSRSACPELHQSAATIVDLTDHVYRVVRSMMGQLRPVALDELGLIPAVQHLIDGWRPRLTGTRFEIVADETLVCGLSEQLNITMFRLVQECLTNVARHASASRITVTIVSDTDRRTLRVKVEDDGVGMATGARGPGLGLIGMRDRVEALSGELTIRSRPGHGVCIEAEVPIETPGFSGVSGSVN